MVSVGAAAGARSCSQPEQSASASRDSSGRMSAHRQGSLSQAGAPGSSSRLQSGWELAQGYSRPVPQQPNPTFTPGTQPVWPPGPLPYMQPQVYMYPSLPGNPPGFFPAQSLHGAQQPGPQMVPQVSMMIPGQQYPGVNPMFPFGMAPSPTAEQWMQARQRPQPMFQGIRPTGWGGMPFQSQPNDPRWQANVKPVAASVPSRRPEGLPQQQPPPPPPRVAPGQQLAKIDRQHSQPPLKPTVPQPQRASRSSSTPSMPRLAVQSSVQTDQQEQASQQPPLGKVPCAFFLKTGTCAYGDKCKFEHPWDKLPVVRFNAMGLPLRQGQPECAYYLRHGRCGFGPSCKFHHPEPGTAGAPAGPESAPTDAVPLPEAAVAHLQPQHTTEQQQDGGSVGLTPSQNMAEGVQSTPEASASRAQGQQSEYVLTQPQGFVTSGVQLDPASVPQTVYGQVPRPSSQVPQPHYTTAATSQLPPAQPQYTTAATSQLPPAQPQYITAPTPSPQLQGSTAVLPQQQWVQQPVMQQATYAQPPASERLDTSAQLQQQDATDVFQPAASGAQQAAGALNVPLAPPAQLPQVLITSVALPTYQLPQRSASEPGGRLPTMQAQVPVAHGGHISAMPTLSAAAPLVQPAPQQLLAQPVAQQGVWLQPAVLSSGVAYTAGQQPPAQLVQQQPPLFVPGQTMLSQPQVVAANPMLPAQAMLPAQQYMATQNVLQALPHVVSSANTQTYQLVPSQALTAAVTLAPPPAGLTPLEQVPIQAGDESHLEGMTEGLPSLETLKQEGKEEEKDELQPLSSSEAKDKHDSKALSNADSDSTSLSLMTPAPSEASLATASTISTSTTFSTSGRSEVSVCDTANAIEAVRKSLGTRDGEGLTLNQLSKQAEKKQM